MSALLDHIRDQQDAMTQLCAVLNALQVMHYAKLDSKIQSELIDSACMMAQQVNNSLDIVNLPTEASHEAA